MAGENKNDKNENLKDKELNLEELENVSGGTIKDVVFKKTVDVTPEMQEKISNP